MFPNVIIAITFTNNAHAVPHGMTTSPVVSADEEVSNLFCDGTFDANAQPQIEVTSFDRNNADLGRQNAIEFQLTLPFLPDCADVSILAIDVDFYTTDTDSRSWGFTMSQQPVSLVLTDDSDTSLLDASAEYMDRSWVRANFTANPGEVEVASNRTTSFGVNVDPTDPSESANDCLTTVINSVTLGFEGNSATIPTHLSTVICW